MIDRLPRAHGRPQDREARGGEIALDHRLAGGVHERDVEIVEQAADARFGHAGLAHDVDDQRDVDQWSQLAEELDAVVVERPAAVGVDVDVSALPAPARIARQPDCGVGEMMPDAARADDVEALRGKIDGQDVTVDRLQVLDAGLPAIVLHACDVLGSQVDVGHLSRPEPLPAEGVTSGAAALEDRHPG